MGFTSSIRSTRTQRPRSGSATTWLCLLTFTLAAVARPATAGAAPTDDAAAVEARKHYDEGTKAFNLAEFPRAITEFKAAYNAKPDPLLLYNIAQAFRLGGDEGQALLFYKSFLRNMPEAPNRKDVEVRIRALEKQVAEHKKESAGAAPPVSAVPGPMEPLKTPPPLEAPVPRTTERGAGASPPPAAAGGVAVAAPVRAPTSAAVPPAPRPSSSAAAPLGPVRVGAPSPPRSATGASEPEAVAPTPLAGSDLGPVALALPPASPPTTTATPPGIAGGLASPSTNDRDSGESRPLYTRWWFWTAVGAVALVAIAAAGNAKRAPSTDLGTYKAFP